jgi:hypothetical protein
MRTQCFASFIILVCLAPAQQVVKETYRGGMVTPPLPKPKFVLTETSGAPFDFRSRTQGAVTLSRNSCAVQRLIRFVPLRGRDGIHVS